MAAPSPKSNNLATILVAVVMFGGMLSFVYWKYLWTPYSTRIDKAEKQITGIKQDIIKAKQAASKIDALSAEIEKLKKQATELETRLPKDKKVPDLIRNITAIGQDYGVNIARITPMQPIQRPYYNALTYYIEANGTFTHMGRFLAALAVSKRIFIVENLVMSGSADSVSARFNLIACQYKPI